MELKVIDQNGVANGVLAVSDALFGREYNEGLVYQLLRAYLANARGGNRAQKTRSEVAKSTKKPWRQKGTGRARAGKASSPIWRGGGRAFPSLSSENFTQKVNRKMYRAGVAVILSRLIQDDRLVVVEDFDVEAPKTRLFLNKLSSLGISSGLLVTKDLSENLYLASRNVANVLVLEALQLDPYSLVRFPKVIMTRSAIKSLEEQWV